MTDSGNHLIWLAGVSWDGIRGTDRHLVTALARHTRIVWVDPAISPVASAVRRSSTRQRFRPLLSVIDDQIIRLTPMALPGLSRPGVRATTPVLLRAQIRWALRHLRIKAFAVVATYLSGGLGYWGADVANVLYGTDDYVAGAELMGLSAAHQRRRELRDLMRADVVAAVSPQLAERWAKLGAEPVVIPNGCWPAESRHVPYPAGLPDLPRPVVGLVGQLSERIDLSTLEAIADAGLSLLLVGPLDSRWETDRFAKLAAKPHVHYTGQVPAEAVPSYLATIDVGITPYRDSPFNRASFPLKTLEYLAAGLPVVSTKLPTAQWLLKDLTLSEDTVIADQILALAGTNAEFINAIRRLTASWCDTARAACAMTGDAGDHLRAERSIAFAIKHSWPRRAEQFAAIIDLLPADAGKAAELEMTSER